ncbi:MAG: hypothetical protein AVDCRST_MAG40-1903, partial [uncultured Gemmatimonadaceae bacterium]
DRVHRQQPCECGRRPGPQRAPARRQPPPARAPPVRSRAAARRRRARASAHARGDLPAGRSDGARLLPAGWRVLASAGDGRRGGCRGPDGRERGDAGPPCGVRRRSEPHPRHLPDRRLGAARPHRDPGRGGAARRGAVRSAGALLPGPGDEPRALGGLQPAALRQPALRALGAHHARPCGRRRVPDHAGVPRPDARRHAAHGLGGRAGAPGGGAHPLRAGASHGGRPRGPRGRELRLLRGGSRRLRRAAGRPEPV